MPKIIFLILVLLAVTSAASADVFLKKASLSGNLGATLRSPFVIMAVGLYLIQIFLYIYVFVSGAKLSVVGVLQTILYAVIVLAAGSLLFQETLSSVQITGVVLGLIGVILLQLG